MSFAAAIKAFEEKALRAANTSLCKAFEILAVDAIILTGDINYGKYSQGHIANNWHPSVGTPNLVVDSAPNRSGTASFERIRAFVTTQPFYRKDNTVYLSNGVNYSFRADKIGYPKGLGTNGWVWSGRVIAYGFTMKAINNLKGKYM